MTKTLALILALAAPVAALAQAPCSKADATKAEKAIDRIGTWPQMQKAARDFANCDTGQVEEVFTESLIRMIVEWKQVDAFAAAMQDATFKAFVHKHLRTPAAKEDLASIYSRAKASCPAVHQAFCAELAEFAKSADAK